MKIKKLIFLIFFILVSITSLFVNIYITKSGNVPSAEMFDLDGIYFDLSLLENKSRASEIKSFINSKNISYYNSAISQKDNPVEQFYALCGYLKVNQIKAGKSLETLLLDKQKVNIFVDADNFLIDYPAGYAYLKLINDFPEELASKPEADFYSNIEHILLRAYKSKLAEENSNYKRMLLTLIAKRNPNILSEVVKDAFAGKSIDSMSQDEKVELSFLIHSLNGLEREKVIRKFLKEKNDKILINTLNAINENDSEETASVIKKLFNGSNSPEVITLAIEKYGMILKKDSLENIANAIKDSDNEKVIKAGLIEVGKYGNEDNYELLKLFLALKYSEDINLLALDAIIQTIYKSKPDDVLNTMAFILRKGKESLAQAAVKFFISKNLYQNSGLVLFRLKQRESSEMDKLALEYMDYFRLKEGASLIRDLTRSNDPEIKEKAVRLMKKLNISDVATDEEIENEKIIIE